eukprot:scaffold135204_cov12-Tisochrysis_lutea.AAC.1
MSVQDSQSALISSIGNSTRQAPADEGSACSSSHGLEDQGREQTERAHYLPEGAARPPSSWASFDSINYTIKSNNWSPR